MVEKAKSSSDLLRENFDWPLTAGQVSEITGVTSRALQHYDKKGLLCPARSGEDQANNRKLYELEDVERLKQIVVLRDYGFALDEMRPVLDGELSVVQALEERLYILQGQMHRLRNLVLFARFARIVGEDLFETLAFGTSQIDVYAEMLRETDAFQERVEIWESLDEKGMERMEGELHYILLEFLTTEDFIDIECVVQELRSWFSRFMHPIGEYDLLNIWALFADESDEAAFASEVGDASTPGFLQASVFLVWLQSMLKGINDFVKEHDILGLDKRIANGNGLVQLIGFVCRESGYPTKEAAQLDKEVWTGMVDYFSEIMGYFSRALSDDNTVEIAHLDIENELDAEFFVEAGKSAREIRLFE